MLTRATMTSSVMESGGCWMAIHGIIANRWGCNVGSGGMDRRIARATDREDQIRTLIVDKLLLSC